MSNPYQQAAKHYQTTELQDQVNQASPHQLIDMLFTGAKKYITTAKMCMDQNQIEAKGIFIAKATDIVIYLQSILDMDKGGDISIRLDKLYDYIQMILLQGHLHNNIAQLDEAHKLIDEIHDGWQQIAKEVDQIDPQQVAANDESRSSL